MLKKELWIIANFKSQKNITQALDWLSVVGPKLHKNENLKIVVCPVFTDLSEVKKEVLTSGYPIMVGSQDISPFPEGAYTGEEAASILKNIVDLAILGHSERRKNFGETDEQIAEKVKQAKQSDIIPLVCVQGSDTPVPEGADLVAYEPVWAIGTGEADTPADANEVAGKLKGKYPGVTVLYGGSVDEGNVKAFVGQENINGCLIATASLDPEQFLKIINSL